MKMDFNLNLTQEQKLVMTQQMQLSVKLLQMSSFELQEFVEKELQENPVLEYNYNEEETTGSDNLADYNKLAKYLEFDSYAQSTYDKNEEDVSPFNFIASEKSLNDFLHEQISELKEKESLKLICGYIVDNIDERGYLDTTIESIAEELKIPLHYAEKALGIVQSFDPPGVGARNLKECLKLQLKVKGIEDPNIFSIIDNYLEYLAENKYNLIARELRITPKEVQDSGDKIKTLEPKPSRGFYTGDEVKFIKPDAYVTKINNEYQIIMNDNMSKSLSVNNIYKNILNENSDKKAVEYVKEKLNNAAFLIKSIDHRNSTIYKVLEYIIKFQKNYFDHGENFLKPMTLKEISVALNVHESTISRAIKEKYIYTDKGIVKIKNLFTTGISAQQSSDEDVSARKIKNSIKELIDKENKQSPLSDQAICDILNTSSVKISRRTVAKYREEIGIKSSSMRKRL